MSATRENLVKKKIWEVFTKTSATAMVLMHGDSVPITIGALTNSNFQILIDTLKRCWIKLGNQSLDHCETLNIDDQSMSLFARWVFVGSDLVGMLFPSATPFNQIQQDVEGISNFLRDIKTKPEQKPALERSLQLTGQLTNEPEETLPDWKHPVGWLSEVDLDEQNEEKPVPEEPRRRPKTDEKQPNQEQQENAKLGDNAQLTFNEQAEPQSTEGKYWQPLDSLFSKEKGDGEADYQGENHMEGLSAQIGQAGMLFQEEEKTTQLPGAPNFDGQHQGNRVGDEKVHTLKRQDDEDRLTEFAKPITGSASLTALAETVFDTTFYLVPRLNDHYLLGELALRLRGWLPTLCEVYGWELTFLSLRPNYIKWTFADFPECLKLDMLSIVRRWTSKQIFKDFPQLQTGNPSGDFWSPGYLVDTQNREFPTQMLITHFSREGVKNNIQR